MILDLFAVRVGLWSLDLGDAFNAALVDHLIETHRKHSTGDEIWNRAPHNLFDGSNALCMTLARRATACLSEFIGDGGRVNEVNGLEIVRRRGVEIMPHCDSDEAHIHGAYFPMGASIDSTRSLREQANQYGANGYAVCGPDYRTPGGHAPLLPWELHRKYWVRPLRGLFVAFDARATHFQKPVETEDVFAQVLLNFKVEAV